MHPHGLSGGSRLCRGPPCRHAVLPAAFRGGCRRPGLSIPARQWLRTARAWQARAGSSVWAGSPHAQHHPPRPHFQTAHCCINAGKGRRVRLRAASPPRRANASEQQPPSSAAFQGSAEVKPPGFAAGCWDRCERGCPRSLAAVKPAAPKGTSIGGVPGLGFLISCLFPPAQAADEPAPAKSTPEESWAPARKLGLVQ